MTTPGEVEAWWFVKPNRYGVAQLRYPDNRLVRPGETLRDPVDRYGNTGETILCFRGFHASVRVLDALDYVPAPVVCRVRLSGDFARSRPGGDKLAASERTVLWMVDAEPVLHTFAVGVAEGILRVEVESGRKVPHGWRAVLAAKRAWILDRDDQRLNDAIWRLTAGGWAGSRKLGRVEAVVFWASSSSMTSAHYTRLLATEWAQKSCGIQPGVMRRRLNALAERMLFAEHERGNHWTGLDPFPGEAEGM